ncbi:MAG TPA: hypothetical protein VLA37_01090 [Sphingomonadaceae bacterium]|nr:hypothetical protein [Sphingomonadaceae bacterium]
MQIDRRSMIKGSIAAGGAVLVPASLAAAESVPALFVYDERFSPSRARAAYWSERGVAVIDSRREDLGVAWRGRIPALISENRRVEGLTLWSDRFICETFGDEHGLRIEIEAARHDPPALQAWKLA